MTINCGTDPAKGPTADARGGRSPPGATGGRVQVPPTGGPLVGGTLGTPQVTPPPWPTGRDGTDAAPAWVREIIDFAQDRIGAGEEPRPTFFFLAPGGKVMAVEAPDFAKARAVLMPRLARLAHLVQARAVAFLMPAWISSRQAPPDATVEDVRRIVRDTPLPSEDPPRRSAVIVTWLDRDGDAQVWSRYYARQDGRIVPVGDWDMWPPGGARPATLEDILGVQAKADKEVDDV